MSSYQSPPEVGTKLRFSVTYVARCAGATCDILISSGENTTGVAREVRLAANLFISILLRLVEVGKP